MPVQNEFDVVVVGGSYAGLSAAMALGRALKRVLILDDGKPCNAQTPHSHNFLTHDGNTPASISQLATEQVLNYPSVEKIHRRVISVTGTNKDFLIKTNEESETFSAKKILFATGMRDIMPKIKGFSECWGISILHCPYCHGYEVREQETGIFSNGDFALEFVKIISNWTSKLTLFTNGKHTLSKDQLVKIEAKGVGINEKEIEEIEHVKGYIKRVIFKDGSDAYPRAIYSKPDIIQACEIPKAMGCELTESGHIKIDDFHKTTIPGIYAAGDNSFIFRAVSIAVASGTKAGAFINKELVEDDF